MKNRFNLMGALISIVALTSCDIAPDMTGEFRLIPQPQEIEMTGVSKLATKDLKQYYLAEGAGLTFQPEFLKALTPVSEPSDAQLVIGLDPSLDLKAEGYTLEINENQVKLTGKDGAGLIYALMTLAQIVQDAGEQNVKLPLCAISDYPELSYRAIHIDIKHHRETKEYYYQLMDRLARYKINAIIAEVEDKLAYQRQPLVGSVDALSISEWRELSDYAMDRNIEISPLIQGLGHASFILKHREYEDLRDDPESDWAFNPLNPKTYDVQFDLYLDAFEAFPHGRYLHVGGDEVHTTGRNSGKTELELQLTWLNKVAAFAGEHNRIPVFWDDMPIKYADLWQSTFDLKATPEEAAELWKSQSPKLEKYLDMFPQNCIYMRWNYESPGAEGSLQAMEWFIEHGFQVMGATAGQTTWVLIPSKESNMDNIKSFTEASIDKGLDGLFLTLWDDSSPHFELYQRGILFFAEYSWSGTQRSKNNIKSAYRQQEFSHEVAGEEFAFVESLENTAAWWKNAILADGNRAMLLDQDDPSTAVIDLPSEEEAGIWTLDHKESLEKARWIADESAAIASLLEKIKDRSRRNLYRLDVYAQVNEAVHFTARMLLALEVYDLAGNPMDKEKALDVVRSLPRQFEKMRTELEASYSKTRLIHKPEGYILDQDWHHHLANQSVNMDWQFMPEILLLKKIEECYSDL